MKEQQLYRVDCSDPAYPRVVPADDPAEGLPFRDAKRALVETCRSRMTDWRDRLREARKITPETCGDM